MKKKKRKKVCRKFIKHDFSFGMYKLRKPQNHFSVHPQALRHAYRNEGTISNLFYKRFEEGIASRNDSGEKIEPDRLVVE